MTLLQQILIGTSLLAFCAIVHVGMIAFSIPLYPRLARIAPRRPTSRLRIILFLCLTVLVLVAAHTIEIWTWAVVFLLTSKLSAFQDSFYFATVTYTTLGYGDIVLGPDARILATFCAITGLLTFGISTAFLIGVLSRILPDVFAPKSSHHKE